MSKQDTNLAVFQNQFAQPALMGFHLSCHWSKNKSIFESLKKAFPPTSERNPTQALAMNLSILTICKHYATFSFQWAPLGLEGSVFVELI